MPEDQKITIIGLGLIGGSIGLGLKAAAGTSAVRIVGHDRERPAEHQAQKIGAIDKGEHNLPRAVQGARMVIIATPVLSVREVMEQIAPGLEEGAVVTDTASTKASVMGWARDLLPARVSFVGGHPMAGKENQGIGNAQADLFRDRAYCICPSLGATPDSIKSVMGLAYALGANPLFIDPDEHDMYAAAVSHLPLMISTALFHLLRASPSWDDMGQMASTGFRDLTRLASGDPQMSHDIWVTNREAIIHWLDRMMDELKVMRDQLKDARDEALLETFARAHLERERFLQNPPRRVREPLPAPKEGAPNVLDMLVGGMLADRMRRVQRMPELMREAAHAREGEEGRPSRVEKMAEDIRRDLEKLEGKRRQREGGENAPEA
jgi:prephenate dehydrogenase